MTYEKQYLLHALAIFVMNVVVLKKLGILALKRS